MFYGVYILRGLSLDALAACRTLEESAAKQPNFAEISAKIVKYVQYSRDFGKKSALFEQFFATIPKVRQTARESIFLSNRVCKELVCL